MAKYITKQRRILQEYLENKIDEELSAKKVAEDLADKNVSLSAIYRNLTEMEKEKEIVQCSKEGSREFYFRYIKNNECTSSLHYSCKICNTIKHMSIEETNYINQRILENLNFTLDLPSTIFYGICDNCKSI